jgi:uncharacterized protein YjbJ (UPF0337 family)
MPLAAFRVGPANAGAARRHLMQDKIKGEGNEIKGTIKEQAGKLGGDKSTEMSGKWDKAKGEVQEKIGDAKINANKP